MQIIDFAFPEETIKAKLETAPISDRPPRIPPMTGPTLSLLLVLKLFWFVVSVAVTLIVVKLVYGVELCRIKTGITVEFDSTISGSEKDEAKINKKNSTFFQETKEFSKL